MLTVFISDCIHRASLTLQLCCVKEFTSVCALVGASINVEELILSLDNAQKAEKN